MKPLDELLNEREFFIYQEVIEKERTFKSVGEDLGITGNRVSQLLNIARRKVRDAKRRDINTAWNDEEVSFTLQRREIYLIKHALDHYSRKVGPSIKDIRMGEYDPEYEMMHKLQEKLHAAIRYEDHPERVDFEEYWNQDAGF